ncbi:hypothetical protein LZ198_05390 [Myxococcus sp. K15C18031901]|nr:hypothetical protein [Myxococcus dinghuensis]
MERHQVGLVGVVGEQGGLLGLISEQHILAAWGVDPLAPVSAVMARVGPAGARRRLGSRLSPLCLRGRGRHSAR